MRPLSISNMRAVELVAGVGTDVATGILIMPIITRSRAIPNPVPPARKTLMRNPFI